MSPLDRYEAEVRHVVEWAVLVTDGIDPYNRNVMSIREET